MAPARRGFLQNSWLIPVAREKLLHWKAKRSLQEIVLPREMGEPATENKKASATDPASKGQGDATIALP